MVRWLLSSMLCLVFLGVGSPVFADDDCKCEDDPRCCFDFDDDDDSIKTDSGKAERTFSLPPLKGGFVVDFYNRDILPHISVGLKEFGIPKIGDFSFDFGVGTSRVFAALTWEIIPIVKIGPCLWAGYNIRENEPAFGLGLSMLDF